MGFADILVEIVKHPIESFITGVLVFALIEIYRVFRPQTQGRWGILMDQNFTAALTSIELISIVGTVGLLVLIGSYVFDNTGF